MTRPSTLLYFVREALRDLWDRRSVTILSMATIAASLYIVGLFFLSARGVQTLLVRWGDELSVTVFLGEQVKSGEVEAVRREIEAAGAVRSFDYVDREEALSRFRSEFPDLADLPEMLEDNPFPASFEIQIRPEHGSPAEVAGFAKRFEGMPGVADVRFDAAWVERFRSLLRVAGVGGTAVGAILLGAAVLTISSVVRMGVYERRDEIEILRLVGANPSFIRAPFLIEGAMQGLAGGIAAISAIVLTALALAYWAGAVAVVLSGSLAGTFLRPLDAGLLLAAGALLGLAGSVIAGVKE
jgi:cell division transport system permease protein